LKAFCEISSKCFLSEFNGVLLPHIFTKDDIVHIAEPEGKWHLQRKSRLSLELQSRSEIHGEK